MKNVFKKFLSSFGIFFKLIEENQHFNIIHSVGKDLESQTVVFLAPIGAKQIFSLHPHQIMQNSIIKNHLRASDIKIVETLLISEGDIFIESKEYRGDDEVFSLKSLLNEEKWLLTEAEIHINKEIFNRLNKRYFKTQLNPKFVCID